MKRFLLLLAVTLGALLSTGCATMSDAAAARGTGMSRTYDQPYDTVWDAVLATVRETDLAIASSDKQAGTVMAQRSMTAFSWGENVAIFVDRVDGRVSTRVEIVNKKALATNVTAPDWETRLFKSLDERLKKN